MTINSEQLQDSLLKNMSEREKPPCQWDTERERER